jgi:hypothetical protein
MNYSRRTADCQVDMLAAPGAGDVERGPRQTAGSPADTGHASQRWSAGDQHRRAIADAIVDRPKGEHEDQQAARGEEPVADCLPRG